MEKLKMEELQRALGGMERDQLAMLDRLLKNKKEQKDLEEELDYSYEMMQDVKRRIKELKKQKS
jgi:hypothetical protein